jgi:hypothetical protein
MTAFSLKTNPKGFLQQVVGKLYKNKAERVRTFTQIWNNRYYLEI